jgi:hypothetical protein
MTINGLAYNLVSNYRSHLGLAQPIQLIDGVNQELELVLFAALWFLDTLRLEKVGKVLGKKFKSWDAVFFELGNAAPLSEDLMEGFDGGLYSTSCVVSTYIWNKMTRFKNHAALYEWILRSRGVDGADDEVGPFAEFLVKKESVASLRDIFISKKVWAYLFMCRFGNWKAAKRMKISLSEKD